MTYTLHYAPDNASLIIRMALEHIGVPYQTALVDRSTNAQTAPAYLAINPNGLIPTLETPTGPIFETGAILLWLTDRHGGLGPAPDEPERGDFLKWLFYLANTVHPALRMTFYPDKYINDAAGQDALRLGLQKVIAAQFETLNTLATSQPVWFGGPEPTALDFYFAGLARWPTLYPAGTDRGWYNLSTSPALYKLCAALEEHPVTRILEATEGLGPRPFTDPHPVNPPYGSAL